MVDKITALRSGRIQAVMGRLTASQLELVDEALRLWLGLEADPSSLHGSSEIRSVDC